jgi:hypothetical protein
VGKVLAVDKQTENLQIKIPKWTRNIVNFTQNLQSKENSENHVVALVRRKEGSPHLKLKRSTLISEKELPYLSQKTLSLTFDLYTPNYIERE